MKKPARWAQATGAEMNFCFSFGSIVFSKSESFGIICTYKPARGAQATGAEQKICFSLGNIILSKGKAME